MRLDIDSLGEPLVMPCAENWVLKNETGDEYLVQVGFPRGWRTNVPAEKKKDVPIVYVQPTGNATCGHPLEVRFD
jgi:hypothetical protein